MKCTCGDEIVYTTAMEPVHTATWLPVYICAGYKINPEWERAEYELDLRTGIIFKRPQCSICLAFLAEDEEARGTCWSCDLTSRYED